MPAPPSPAQKAANQKAMTAAKSVSGASRSTAGKTSGGFSGGAGAGGGGLAGALGGFGGVTRAGVGGGAGAQVGLQQQRGGLLGTGGGGMNFSGYGNYSGPTAGLGGGGLLGGSGQTSPLMQEAMRRSAAQAMANQYSQYRSPPSVPGPGQRVTDVFGPSYPQDPSIAGRLQRDAVNPMAPQSSGSYLAENFGNDVFPTYSGPKGAFALNDEARLAAARAQGYTGGLTKPNQSDVDSMSRMMMAESSMIRNPMGNMSIPGATAVGSVIANRMASPKYPNTLSGVLNQPKQFSPTKEQLAAQNPDYAVNDVARAILSGEQPSNVGSSLNYGNLDTIMNKPGYSSPATKSAFGSMDPVATFADAKNPGTFQHSFGTIGQPAETVMAGQPRMTPTMAAPQAPQGTLADTAKSMWQNYAPEGLQQAAVKAQEVLINTPAQKIAEYGGFKRAGELAQLAVKINDFLPGGTGLQKTQQTARYDERRGAGGDVLNDRRDMKKEEAAAAVPPGPVTPPVTPPSAPMWSYPQYTQAWANLPTGVGGPIWRPSAPTGGIFDVKPDKKKKRATA